MPLRTLLAVCLAALSPAAPAQVVINEILYHAPDDLDDLQYVELHNAGDAPVDLGGWRFTKGLKYQFPPGTRIDGHGFVVICRNTARFREFYQAPVAGEFQSRLSRKGERIELADASGRPVDAVKFDDQPPWPRGADGESGSLERICPGAPGDQPANWISSPLAEDRDHPAGTPGRPNAGFSATLPPVIRAVTFSPELPNPDQPVTVEAELRPEDPVAAVSLRFRLAGPGYEKPESVLPMTQRAPGRYVASLPGQPVGQLIRFRVEATSPQGARRLYPAETEPRPALSAYVPGPIEPAAIPFGWIVHTTEKEMKAAQNRDSGPQFGGFGGFGGFPPGGFRPPPPDPDADAREEATQLLHEKLDLSALWLDLALGSAPSHPAAIADLRSWMLGRLEQRRKLMDSSLTGTGLRDRLGGIAGAADEFLRETVAEAQDRVDPARRDALATWLRNRSTPRPPLEQMVTLRIDLEGAWHAVSLNADPDPGRLPVLLATLRELYRQRSALLADAAAEDPATRDSLRARTETLQEALPAALNPHLTGPQRQQLDRWSQSPREVVVGLRRESPGGGGPPPGFGGPPPGFGGPPPGLGGPREPMGPVGPMGPMGPMGAFRGPFGAPESEPGSHLSAFVYFDPATRKVELFDFVQVTGRKGGQKVHFHGDRPLGTMTTIGLIFEGDTPALVEPLAYEVYRRAGMPVEQSHYVRLWQDGKPSGYTVLIEQPNGAFLRRNDIPTGGNLYKLLWYGGDLVGQHEKHSQRHTGHDDLAQVVNGLREHTGAAQWEFIRHHFDVDQVATYFAVNMLLSHWDGFFNNYFAYHAPGDTGKWRMFPWDQDSTWGLRGSEDQVFFDMALTFGMDGDTPTPNGGSWRPPGWFSGPLLANPEFRKVFLARIRQLLDTVYTEAVFGPIFDRYASQLTPEVRLRAEIQREDPAAAVERLRSDLARCREHIRLRREFLLAQDELRRLGAPR